MNYPTGHPGSLVSPRHSYNPSSDSLGANISQGSGHSSKSSLGSLRSDLSQRPPASLRAHTGHGPPADEVLDPPSTPYKGHGNESWEDSDLHYGMFPVNHNPNKYYEDGSLAPWTPTGK